MITVKDKKGYIHELTYLKHLYLFFFLSEKTKKREYIFYQKCYEKYYGRLCEISYKKFWRMMLRKSALQWLLCVFLPIQIIFLIIILLICLISGGCLDFPSCSKREKRRLLENQRIVIRDELQKQWAEEDRLEALQKQTKKH